MPFAIIFLLFIFLEIAGFVAMASLVGLLGVFALILLGIFAGGFVIKTIGLASVQRMQERAQTGEPVGQEMGGLVLGFLGGVLLIMPGFLTDILGIVLLIKPLQAIIWPRYGSQVAGRMPDVRQGTPFGGQQSWRSPNSQPRPANDDVVIDVETDSAEAPRGSTRGDRNPWGA